MTVFQISGTGPFAGARYNYALSGGWEGEEPVLNVEFRFSANAAARDEIQNAEQNNRANNRDDQAGNGKFLDATDNTKLICDQITDNRANTADNDIPEDAHRGIAVHDKACQPSGARQRSVRQSIP